MQQNTYISFSGYEWLTRERWGEVHPDKPWNWYDPSMRGQISAIIRKHYIKANYDSEIIADEIVDLIKIKYQSK